jgi:hypothetical protein
MLTGVMANTGSIPPDTLFLLGWVNQDVMLGHSPGIAGLRGHSDISISMRYVHPSESAVTKAMTTLSAQFWHSAGNPKLLEDAKNVCKC